MPLPPLIALAMLWAAGCDPSIRTCRSVSGGPDSPVLTLGYEPGEQDRILDRENRDPGTSAGAREWLAGPGHVFLNESQLDPRHVTDELMAAGAVSVRVTDIRSRDGVQEASSLVVRLPSSAEPRRKVIARAEGMSRALGERPAEDTGQAFLVLDLD